jgi:hypothetical protein
LYFDGCANREPVLERLRELVARQATDAEMVPHRVETDEEARRLRFLGSPTVRVDGRDVEPGADVREASAPTGASEDPQAADASPLQCRRVPSPAMPG